MMKPKILFLDSDESNNQSTASNHHSCRAQLCAIWLAVMFPDKYNAYVCWINQPNDRSDETIDPNAVTAMKELGIDTSTHQNSYQIIKQSDLSNNQFDYVVTLGKELKSIEQSDWYQPIKQSSRQTIHEPIENPSQSINSSSKESEILEVYWRAAIEARSFVQMLPRSIDQSDNH